MDSVPLPRKAELEKLLGQGLRSTAYRTRRLSDSEYELALDHICVEQARAGRPLPDERLRLLTAIARMPPHTSSATRLPPKAQPPTHYVGGFAVLGLICLVGCTGIEPVTH